MTARTTGYKPIPIPGPRPAHTYQRGTTSGLTLYNGGVTAFDPNTGLWTKPDGTNPNLVVSGVLDLGDVDNVSTSTDTSEKLVKSGTYKLVSTGLDTKNEGAIVYITDDQTFTLTSGTEPIGGILIQVVDATHGYVLIDPIVNIALMQASGSFAGSGGAGKNAARGVLTNLGGAATYAGGILTGPASTALPTQDNGVAPAVGDVWFAPKALANLPAAAQAGPWVITGLGSGSSAWTAQRPSWYATGSVIPTEMTIRIGPEGLGWKNIRWVSTATPGGLVDTGDPLFVAYDFAAGAGTARLVGTNLGGTATYAAATGITGPANTALPTQDGVAPAVGDRLFLGKWLTNLPAAAQAGPWVVAALGSGASQYQLVRPAEWQTGGSLASESTIKVGPEGAALANSRWTSTATPGGTIDTTDPAFLFDGGPLIAGGIPSSHTVRGVVTVNETLTAFDSVSGGTIRDGVTYAAGDLVLLVGQTSKATNGPYVVGTVAANVAPLSRPPWWQTGAKAQPAFVFVASEGTQGANSQWIVRTPGPITIDTTAIDVDMIGGNWVQGVSTAVGTMSAPSTFFFVGATLKARLSGIFEVHLDVGWSDDTTADSVTFALVTDTVADGSGAVLASANKVNHGVTGLGTFGTRGADWESCDTNAGAAITFNSAAFSTAGVTQASEVAATLTGLLTTNGNGTQKFGFHGIVDNAAPTGTTKTPFAIGNQVAFGVSVTASHVITVKSVRLTVKEMPAQ